MKIHLHGQLEKSHYSVIEFYEVRKNLLFSFLPVYLFWDLYFLEMRKISSVNSVGNLMHRIFVGDWKHILRTQLRLQVPDGKADLTATGRKEKI